LQDAAPARRSAGPDRGPRTPRADRGGRGRRAGRVMTGTPDRSEQPMPHLQNLLAPRSVVIVGASDRGDKPGARITRVLAESGFPGPIYGVNPREIAVPGVTWLPTVDDLPEVPDLACVAVPAEPAVEAFTKLAPRGLPAAVVYSSGFSETGERGRELE